MRCVVVSHGCFNLQSIDDIGYGTSFHLLTCDLQVFDEVIVQIFLHLKKINFSLQNHF